MVIDIKNTTLTILGGGAGESIDVILGTGNITFKASANFEYILDRGKLATGSVRRGDEVPMEVSFDCTYDYFTTPKSGVDYTPYQALMYKTQDENPDKYCDWTTTDTREGHECDPRCVNLVLDNVPPCQSIDGETLTFLYFRCESCDVDVKAGTIKFNGKCNVDVI